MISVHFGIEEDFWDPGIKKMTSFSYGNISKVFQFQLFLSVMIAYQEADTNELQRNPSAQGGNLQSRP